MIKTRIYRYANYFRVGYGKYLSLPLGIFQMVIVVYLWASEKFPLLSNNFIPFVVFGLLCTSFLGTYLGWFDIRKSQIYTTEAIIAAVSNPMAVHMNSIAFEAQKQILDSLKITPSEEWRRLYNYWSKLDENGRWRP